MASRLELQSVFENLLGNDQAYFQPPTSVQMNYPCIVYNLDGDKVEHADNVLYQRTKRYQVTVIDRDPDSELPDKVRELPLCSFSRYFAAENLNHYVFTLFF